MSVVTSTFDLDRALNGDPVGLGLDVDETAQQTGIVVKYGSQYKTVIDGKDITLDKDGKITACMPADVSYAVGTQLVMIDETLTQTYGSSQNYTRNADPNYSDDVFMASMEPRDEFAVHALGVLLQKMKDPESVSDSRILLTCRAAYRWANGMMVAAANSRTGTAPPSPGTGTVTVNEGDLQSNTEKLLYNMVAKFTDLNTKMTELKTQIANDNQGIIENMETIADSFEIPDVGTIALKASIFNSKFIRIEALTDMCYSDVSVYLEMSVTDTNNASGTRKVGYVLPRGSVVVVEALDAEVTAISSITSVSVRGKGANDPNTYTITT